jgi:hypothetical protein
MQIVTLLFPIVGKNRLTLHTVIVKMFVVKYLCEDFQIPYIVFRTKFQKQQNILDI